VNGKQVRFLLIANNNKLINNISEMSPRTHSVQNCRRYLKEHTERMRL
jgi:prephenate dehydratase